MKEASTYHLIELTLSNTVTIDDDEVGLDIVLSHSAVDELAQGIFLSDAKALELLAAGLLFVITRARAATRCHGRSFAVTGADQLTTSLRRWS